jgi:hypothetical protein
MTRLVLRRASDTDAPLILALLREANEPYPHRSNGPSGAYSDTVEDMRAVMLCDIGERPDEIACATGLLPLPPWGRGLGG